MSLRGFENSGVGPRAYPFVSPPPQDGTSKVLGDSLGGDTRSSFLAALSVPIPLPSGNNDQEINSRQTQLRAFVFANAGSLGNLSSWSTHSASASSSIPTGDNAGPDPEKKNSPFFGFVRASVGAGVSLAVADTVRVEASFSFPLVYSKQDNLKSFQLGVGLSMN